MKYLVAAVFAVSFAVAFIAFHKAHAIGIEYQEGIDINIDTSCEPPTERTDGTPITPDEMFETEVVYAQENLFTAIEHRVLVPNIFCESTFALANLGSYGQWYKTARIHAHDGGWSDLQPESVAFMWLAAPPVDLGPEAPQDLWTVHYVSSEETQNWFMPAIQAFDGDTSTLWHTQYTPSEAAPPHYLDIHLGGIYKLQAAQMDPRAAGVNAVVKGYEFHTSMNGATWTMVASGEAPPGDAPVTVEFAPVNAKYLRLVVLSEQDGGLQASVAELRAYGELVVLKPPRPPKNLK